ncbi:MAG TPA: GAF domain-containing protein [Gemmatimonadales bacterium]|nr:GAF domain-containing protein [Gemmatimonadales bacterium]
MPPPPARKAASPERLESLVSAGLLLTSELSLEGVLQRVAELACQIIGSRYAAIGVLSDDHLKLDAFVTTGIDQETRTRIGTPPEGRGVLGLVMRERRIIRLADLHAHPESVGFPSGHPPMKSFLGVPIERRRGVFGILYLTEKVDGPEFTADDEHIAMLLAAQAGAAVENARLHEESARLLEEVQQLQRSRERFFAMVNHELRNALAGVFGWAEMLVRKKDPATVPKAAFEVLDSADQAIALVNDLLDLSRLDEDRLKPVIKEVEPVVMVQRAIGRVTPLTEANRIALEFDQNVRVGTIHTDAHRVEQILINLLVNAIRHAPPASRVTVALLGIHGRVRIEVLDEGPGVPEEDLDRIFDIYQTKGNEAGVGLGLPLSRRLARLLGGDLRAEVRAGTGGCFILELPGGGNLKNPS